MSWADGHSRRVVGLGTFTVLLALTACLAFSATPTLAAPLEAPVTEPATAITGTAATLHGELNPEAKVAAPLEYDFLYRQSALECAEGIVMPEAPVEVSGKPKEPVSTNLTGLEPSRPYTFCVLAQHEAESSIGLPVTFKTLGLAPKVDSEGTSFVNSTSAMLEAQVNPNNQESTFKFEYSTKATGETLEGTITTVEGTVPLPEAFADQLANISTGAVLVPGTTYYYRVVTENGTPPVTKGTVKSFTTVPTPSTDTPSPVAATTATLGGHLKPLNETVATNYSFEYRAGIECTGGISTPTQEAGTGPATEVGATATVSELLPDGEYTVCLLTTNEFGSEQGPPIHFITLPVVPSLASEAAINLGATSAVLAAQINPNGSSTTYKMEYGTTIAYGATIPGANIGSGRFPVSVSQPISGLSANTTYHWRLVAKNSAGTATGPDHTFIFPVAAAEACSNAQARIEVRSTGLPDCREYELVTPPQRNGSLLNSLFGGNTQTQISEDGTTVMTKAVQCFGGSESCVADRQKEGVPFEFARSTAGWVTRPLAPPATAFETNTIWLYGGTENKVLFSSPKPTGNLLEDFYARGEDGSFTDVGPIVDQTIETTEPGYQLLAGGLPVEATSDLSHVVYQTKTREWAFDHGAGAGLYEYVGAGNASPLLVGVTGPQGSSDLVSTCGTSYGNFATRQSNLYGSLSLDGRVLYFTANGGEGCFGSGVNELTAVPARELWARIDGERPDAHSVLISAPAAGVCKTAECQSAPAEDASFVGASSDGSRVFFASTRQLTDQASQDTHEGDTAEECAATTEGFSGCNLYESECPAHCEDPAQRRLIDISKGAKETGGPKVQGVMAISPDGSHVYFVAKGVLAAGAQPQAENLYVYNNNSGPEGHLSFITTLLPSDEEEWNRGLGDANVTPEGRFLLLTSHRALTGDNQRPEGPLQVYRYDAQSGTLIRISIGDGGFNDNGNAGTGDAGIAQARFSFESGFGSARADPSMSHDGDYVFFQSPVALTPGALDDVPVGTVRLAENIYEYHHGHVYLISDGRDVTQGSEQGENAVELFGTDAAGSNVFFRTNDQLIPQDTNTQQDYYDARICTTEQPCLPPEFKAPASCTEEACHGTLTAATARPAPGSESFSGPGNLSFPLSKAVTKPKRCKKGFAKKHHRCVKVRAKRKRHKHEIMRRSKGGHQ